MKLFKIIASQGGTVIFDDRLDALTPREARNQMRALLGLRSLTGVVYSITEIPVDLIAEIAESKATAALRAMEAGDPPPSLRRLISAFVAEEVCAQLGRLRAEALAAAQPVNGGRDSAARFDPFNGGEAESPSGEDLNRVRNRACRQLNQIRDQLNGAATSPPPVENVVAQVRANAEERRRRSRGRPAITTDGREIDWPAVRALYQENRSIKQTAAAFDLSVNTVKARARKEGWANS